jgi:hypothetical protein
MAKTPRKTPIHRLIHIAWSLTLLVPLTPIKREAAGAKEAEAEAGVEAGADEDHVWFEDRWMVASLCDE